MADYRISMYSIRRDGQEFGPFSGEEIKEMLTSTFLSGEDEISSLNADAWQKIKNSNLWYNYFRN